QFDDDSKEAGEGEGSDSGTNTPLLTPFVTVPVLDNFGFGHDVDGYVRDGSCLCTRVIKGASSKGRNDAVSVKEDAKGISIKMHAERTVLLLLLK
ncbi:unnamed protein product, partial [Rotaria sp. Silwood1]